jgi:hypothetical protein
VTTEDLQALLRATRALGTVHVVLRDRPLPGTSADQRSLADALALSIGGNAIDDQWREVRRSVVEAGLTSVLGHDMAYGTELMMAKSARMHVSRFLAWFDDTARFLTNGGLLGAAARDPRDLTASWMPVLGATFDTGVVAIDDARIGILWVADED